MPTSLRVALGALEGLAPSPPAVVAAGGPAPHLYQLLPAQEPTGEITATADHLRFPGPWDCGGIWDIVNFIFPIKTGGMYRLHKLAGLFMPAKYILLVKNTLYT